MGIRFKVNKIGKKIWYVELKDKSLPKGKIALGSFYSKTDAREALERAKYQFKKDPKSFTCPTFSEYLIEYRQYCEINKSKKTVTHTFEILEKEFLPLFGDFKLKDITKREVEKYKLWRKKNKRNGRNISNIAINTYLRALNTALNTAVNPLEIIENNPMSLYKKLPEEIKKPQDISLNDIYKWIDALERTYAKVVAELSLVIALRPTEILSILKEDFDTIKKNIGVKTKTQGMQLFPVPDYLMKDMVELKFKSKSEYLFYHERTGDKLKSIRKAFATASRKTGIKIRPKDIRKLSITLFEKIAQKDLLKVKVFARHKSLETTEKHYLLGEVENQRKMAQKAMADYLEKQRIFLTTDGKYEENKFNNS